MKSLKLRKVKISKIGNPHTLFGGATNSCPTTTPPISTDLDCIKTRNPKDTDCATVTNTLPTNRTDPAPVSGIDTGN